MKFTKKNFVVTALIMSCAFISQAQTTSSTPEERAQRWDDWMKKELIITPEQTPGVHAINLKYAQLNEQLKSSDESRKSKFQDVKSNENNKEKELKDILTKEQFKLYEEKKKDMQKQMLQRMRN